MVSGLLKEKVEKIIEEELAHVVENKGEVKVRMKGACAGCPMSQMTLKQGVEKILKKKIPEIKRVEAI